MTFRKRGRYPEPTEAVRALVSLLLPDIDVMSSDPSDSDGVPTQWQIYYGERKHYLPIDATFEEWQELLARIVSENY